MGNGPEGQWKIGKWDEGPESARDITGYRGIKMDIEGLGTIKPTNRWARVLVWLLYFRLRENPMLRTPIPKP
jgi:hypothetical protein